MIDTNIMINFLGTYANEEISKDRYGNKTTVLVEFSEICKDSGKYICMLAEYYTKQHHNNHLQNHPSKQLDNHRAYNMLDW